MGKAGVGHISRRQFLGLASTLGASSVTVFANKGNLCEACASEPSIQEIRIERDSMGRVVRFPQIVRKVAPARPSVQDYLSALAPKKLGAFAFMDARTDEAIGGEGLPVVGALCDQLDKGVDVSLRDFDIDLVVDVENDAPWSVRVADKLQMEAGVPVYVVKRGIRALPAAFEELGSVLGTSRGDIIGKYIADILSQLDEELASVGNECPKVAFVGSRFDTGFGYGKSVFQRELVEIARGTLVEAVQFGLEAECDVIITLSSEVRKSLLDPGDIRGVAWSSCSAVREQRVYCLDLSDVGVGRGMPLLPWSIIGLQWLASVLHPDLVSRELSSIKEDYCEMMFLESGED